ncbi:TPA: hypothetical protein KDX74_003064 [Vibrio parahaemolyticus]|uniref:hypothetical protein n=1 Tax=Vibrio parahaemolyticus TaxID=670 RepID=UPI00248B7955|nr:hypothetical protein [Vibrio parahaemolyticus]HBK3325503.1 hypothetical protein [Vibrio parahaemolyticus]
MPKTLHRLDEVDSDTSIGDKLQKCFDLDIPVLIKVPTSMDVWAIDPKLELLSKKDVVLSESNVAKRIPLRIHLLDGQYVSPLDTPNIHTSSLAASTKLEDVLYLQLKRGDIPKLLAIHQLDLSKFDAVLIYDDVTYECRLNKFVPVSRYSFMIDKTDSHAILRKALMEKFQYTDLELEYVLCRKFSGEEQYNHPLEIIDSYTVTPSECWILEEYLSQLTFDSSSYKTSRYYLESEFHTSTSFVEFSKATYEIVVQGKKSVSGGVSGYLSTNYTSFQAKNVAEGGARVINLIKSDTRYDYFAKLKEIFERYWLSQPVASKAVALKVAHDVLGALEIELELKSTNAKGVEMLLRPDKYK